MPKLDDLSIVIWISVFIQVTASAVLHASSKSTSGQLTNKAFHTNEMSLLLDFDEQIKNFADGKKYAGFLSEIQFPGLPLPQNGKLAHV